MTITTAKLTGIAALAAIAAGLIFIVIQFIHPPENAATVTSVEWAIVSLLMLLAIGSVITILVPVLPHAFERLLALPMGVALAALGFSLWSRQGDASTQSDIGPLQAQLDPVGIQ